MKLFRILLTFIILFSSCDDLTLDQQDGDGNGTVEPLPELILLSSIEIAENVSTNITDSIEIVYNEEDLISQISFSRSNNTIYTFEYASNNRLITIIKNDGNTTTYNLTYVADSVFIEYIELNGNLVEKQLSTDTQNRINRVVTTSTNAAGITSQIEDLRYEYTANFNVDRINSIDSNGFTILSYSEFTYEFNNNPFRDMNDVLRLLIFPEFVPYTRYLPSNRNDYTASSVGFSLDRTFNYLYTLQDDEFPSSREITKTESGTTTTSFEFFNYL